MEVVQGDSVPIPGARSALAFQFADGRIVVDHGENSRWSRDGGRTWTPGGEGPGDKIAVDLGHGEILGIGRNTRRRPDGRFSVTERRSLDNGATWAREDAVLSLPGAGPTVVGSGDVIDGFLFHHGILRLPNGDLVATMYGNYWGDTELCDGYPPELGQRKYRTVVVFSHDAGRTWGEPVLVAYDRMLGRGIPKGFPLAARGYPDEEKAPTAVVPAITQEGFREAGLAQAADGGLVCVMRSGGRNSGAATLFPTPLYCSRSADGGRTWTPPAQIADRGVCPNLAVLDSGVIVCTYGRPGNWLIFSGDGGRTWTGALQFGSTGAYNYIAKVGPDTVQVYHETDEGGAKAVLGTYFTVRRAAAAAR
jgi:hypothetical protein